MKKKVFRERYYGTSIVEKEKSPLKTKKSPLKSGNKTKKGDK